jgi:serine/threonine protein kinase
MFEKKEKKNILGDSTDIWALGVTLFFMLTGKYPHQDAPNLEDL